ncbi:MAG: DUF4190 domain-containing protein [Anaerolineales bacterium]|nr:DUF4190 domain-containing protein [Anaerolineales bacterium]
MSNYSSLPPITRSSTMALVSLIAGIAGWTVLPFLGSIVAIITGHMAKSEISKSGGAVTGGGMATFGLILGYLAVVGGLCLLCIGVILPLVGVTIIPWDSIISSFY